MWIVKSWWKPIDKYDPGVIEQMYTTEEEARKQGLHTACCNGVLKIEVYDHEGELQYSYDKANNIWRDLKEERRLKERARERAGAEGIGY